jgi:hypothetical protein
LISIDGGEGAEDPLDLNRNRGRCIPVLSALKRKLTGATGTGFLVLFPGSTAAPGTSTINFTAGATRANNAVLPLGADGTLGVTPFVSGNGTVHVILDVTGYFQ